MSAVGGNDKAMAVGGEDGASTAEGIGCGAGWSGHNETVASIGGHKVVSHIKVGAEQGAALKEAVEADFVDNKGVNGMVRLIGKDMEEGAGLNGVAPSQKVGH